MLAPCQRANLAALRLLHKARKLTLTERVNDALIACLVDQYIDCLTCSADNAESSCHLAGDDPHDHGLGGDDHQVVQPHGPKQAVGPGEAGVGMDHEGRSLHEGSQVNVHLPLCLCQVPAHSPWPLSVPPATAGVPGADIQP